MLPCFLLLHRSPCPYIVSFEWESVCRIGKLHCIADVQLSADWRTRTRLECTRGCLGICIIVIIVKEEPSLEFFWIINWKYWWKHTSEEN